MFEYIKIFILVLKILGLISVVIFINDILTIKEIIKYNIKTDSNFTNFNTMFKYILKKKLIEYSISTIFLSFIITRILINI